MKKIILSLCIFFLSFNSGLCFTNVSGGIYSNTTWTKANSPYIVTDTIVVFPGVTLTIQPGVTVKFDSNMYIEIRQATILAMGTPTDSITFTTNSTLGTYGSCANILITAAPSTSSRFYYCNFSYSFAGVSGGGGGTHPVPTYVNNSTFTHNKYGVWDMAYLRMDTCNFYYNTIGINGIDAASVSSSKFMYNSSIGISQNFFSDGDTINNCIIEYSSTGLYYLLGGKVKNCTIKYNNWGITNDESTTTEDCIIDSNKKGGYAPGGQDSIIKCTIQYNRVGIIDSIGSTNTIRQNIIQNNTTGLIIGHSDNQIICNSICNNYKYNLYYHNSANVSATHNYWCTADSASTRALIYDGYTNINYGLVYILPLDSSCSPPILTSTNSLNETQSIISIFPNPSNGDFTIKSSTNNNKTFFIIYNTLGQNIYSITLNNTHTNINLSNYPSGIYLFRAFTETGNITSEGKFIIQK